MGIKRIKEITSDEENYRSVPIGPGMVTSRKNSIEPVPVGTLVSIVFRVTGYDRDCDGTLMMRLEAIDMEGNITGWKPDHLGAYPDSTWVVDSPDDLDKLADGEAPRGRDFGESVDNWKESSMLDKALQRPLDFESLSTKDQWAVDKKLGTLDWNPTLEYQQEYVRRRAEMGDPSCQRVAKQGESNA